MAAKAKQKSDSIIIKFPKGFGGVPQEPIKVEPKRVSLFYIGDHLFGSIKLLESELNAAAFSDHKIVFHYETGVYVFEFYSDILDAIQRSLPVFIGPAHFNKNLQDALAKYELDNVNKVSKNVAKMYDFEKQTLVPIKNKDTTSFTNIYDFIAHVYLRIVKDLVAKDLEHPPIKFIHSAGFGKLNKVITWVKSGRHWMLDGYDATHSKIANLLRKYLSTFDEIKASDESLKHLLYYDGTELVFDITSIQKYKEPKQYVMHIEPNGGVPRHTIPGFEMMYESYIWKDYFDNPVRAFWRTGKMEGSDDPVHYIGDIRCEHELIEKKDLCGRGHYRNFLYVYRLTDPITGNRYYPSYTKYEMLEY